MRDNATMAVRSAVALRALPSKEYEVGLMDGSLYDLTRLRTVLLRGVGSSFATDLERVEWQEKVDEITAELNRRNEVEK